MKERGISIEESSGGIYHARINGPITDVHMHPRIFDPRFFGTELGDIANGKAGLHMYSQAALRGGFYRGMAMTNESLRIFSPDEPDQTELIPYPVTKVDRLLAAASVIIQRSLMQIGIIMSVDREAIGLGQAEKKPAFTTKEIGDTFSNKYVRGLTGALKIFGNPSTGGFNIPPEYVIPVAKVWHKHNPIKPVGMHLENELVGQILEEWPEDIPAHIAHVSSRQELAAVIEAKDRGKDVTCEATPHHMFLTEATKEAIGPTGCMLPTLKSQEDRQYLWDNKEYIDIFASDCAPHRMIDKVGVDGKGLEKPANGVTNHDVFLPLYLAALIDGKLTEQELYERLVINPMNRFNLPDTRVHTSFVLREITAEEATKTTEYGCSPFVMSPETPKMIGRISTMVGSDGRLMISTVGNEPLLTARPGYQNLIRF